MKRNKSAGLVFGLCFIAGAAAGAAVALVVPPFEGAQARRAAARAVAPVMESAQFLWDVARAKAATARGASAQQWARLSQAVGAGLEEARRVRIELTEKTRRLP